MAFILLITLGVLASVAVVTTLRQVTRDGYRAIPLRPERMRRP